MVGHHNEGMEDQSRPFGFSEDSLGHGGSNWFTLKGVDEVEDGSGEEDAVSTNPSIYPVALPSHDGLWLWFHVWAGGYSLRTECAVGRGCGEERPEVAKAARQLWTAQDVPIYQYGPFVAQS